MNQVDSFIANLNPDKAALLQFLMRVVFECDKTLIARISYGLPFIYGKKGICYFNTKPTGIDVGFMYGNKLKERPEFIVGDRVQVRSLFFSWEEDVDNLLFKEVAIEALELDRSRK